MLPADCINHLLPCIRSAQFHRYAQHWRYFYCDPAATASSSDAVPDATALCSVDTWDMTWEARFYISEVEYYDVSLILFAYHVYPCVLTCHLGVCLQSESGRNDCYLQWLLHCMMMNCVQMLNLLPLTDCHIVFWRLTDSRVF